MGRALRSALRSGELRTAPGQAGVRGSSAPGTPPPPPSCCAGRLAPRGSGDSGVPRVSPEGPGRKSKHPVLRTRDRAAAGAPSGIPANHPPRERPQGTLPRKRLPRSRFTRACHGNERISRNVPIHTRAAGLRNGKQQRLMPLTG